MTLEYKFFYADGDLRDNCGNCLHCVKWECVKGVPGPRKHCGFNSACDEWVKREIKLEPTLWQMFVSFANHVFNKEKENDEMF